MMSMVARSSSSATSRIVRSQSVGKPKALRTRNVRVRAALQAETKPAIAQFSDSIGLPTDEGLFGFKPFSEVWCGRLAMMGFVSSIAVELQTGKGTLQQIGISPSSDLLMGLVAVFGVATAGAAGYTAFLGLSGKMPKSDGERYRKFLLLDGEEEMISNARATPTIADKFLSADNSQQEAEQASTSTEASVAAAEASTSSSSAAASAATKVLSYDDKTFNNMELRYARTVEVDNGRAAMLGFLAAVLVEAGTGKGIIMQLIMWFKIMGLLGAASGF